MKKLILAATLMAIANPVLAKEYIIKEISDPAGKKPYYFSPDKLTIQPGDTVTFVNAQDDMHDVMFVNVPKGVDEMIMSKMHEKEGQKFSHTFDIAGTYQFHCHPHEALGMKGTLIVGQASKPGETVAMDHHKMSKIVEGKTSGSQVAGNTALPEGTGKINSVDTAGRTINVTHDPIKALGWPKMKMEFQVEQGIDLSSFNAGDAIAFTLKPKGDDDFMVVKLGKK